MKLALKNQPTGLNSPPIVATSTPPRRGIGGEKRFIRVGLMSVLKVLTIACCLLPLASPTQATPKEDKTCPSDLQTLMSWMLKDLPGYGNRVTQRARRSDRTVEVYNYILVAGNPEFEPLPLSNLQYESELPDDTKQVFFTTLERQYTPTEAILLQNYYWLFLTPSSEGWRVVLLFSQLADLEQRDLPLPPQDAINGAIGQGIKLWLKDCRAGVLRP
ncbi:MAG: hypothetical protein AB4063_05485 [Crocosphaera sp.]